MTHLHLTHNLSPGDVVVMTAAVESLHRQYPGEYATSVETSCQELWKYNPWVVGRGHQARVVPMHYDAIHQCNQRSVHFMLAFCEHLANQIGRPVPLLTNRPHLYLGPDEIGPPDEVQGLGPYVVVNAGRKNDYTAKFAGTWLWQEVVDRIKDRITVVQVGEDHPAHLHRPLKGVVNLIGKTSLRGFLRLVRHARACAGTVSFMLHASAAFGTPYVCVAGGREPASWVSYDTTTYLHTIGQLDCCRSQACWKSRTVPLGDGDEKDSSRCVLPVLQPDGEAVPRCLQMIGPERVALALLQILDGRESQSRENHHFNDHRVVMQPQPGAAVVLPPGGPPRLAVSMLSSFIPV